MGALRIRVFFWGGIAVEQEGIRYDSLSGLICAGDRALASGEDLSLSSSQAHSKDGVEDSRVRCFGAR